MRPEYQRAAVAVMALIVAGSSTWLTWTDVAIECDSVLLARSQADLSRLSARGSPLQDKEYIARHILDHVRKRSLSVSDVTCAYMAISLAVHFLLQ
jgi:hypothetical protein